MPNKEVKILLSSQLDTVNGSVKTVTYEFHHNYISVHHLLQNSNNLYGIKAIRCNLSITFHTCDEESIIRLINKWIIIKSVAAL